MTKVNVTPSEKIINKVDSVISDSLGREIRIKIPDALDEFDLASALGSESTNNMCFAMAAALLYVLEIDGVIFNCPKTYSEVRAGIKRLGKEGIKAIMDEIKNLNPEENNEIDRIKKS